MIQAVIFDCGGVICRAEDESGRHKWEDYLALPRETLATTIFESNIAYQTILGQATEDDVWQQIALDFKLNEAKLAELRIDFWSGHIVDQDLLQFIQALRPNYKTAILSNFWTGAREKFDQLFGLRTDIFNQIILSSEEGLAKPDIQFYQLAANRLNIPPESAVFVDDVAENIKGARQAGMSGVLFKNTPQAIKQVQQYLDRT